MMGDKAVRFIPLALAWTALLSTSVKPGPAYGLSSQAAKPAAGQESQIPAPPENFQIALKAAETNLASQEGKTYDKEMRDRIGTWLSSEVSRCASQRHDTAFGPFVVLLRIGDSGKAEEVLTWPETHIADCLKPKLAEAEYPKPPGPSWWFKIDVRIEFKDVEGAQNNPPKGTQGAGGIVYGSEIGIMISAPASWVLDNTSGVSQGVHAVMYPKGSSWQKSPDVMYVNIGKLGPGETLEAFIAADVKKFQKEFQGIRIEELEPIALPKGGRALVRVYGGGAYHNVECVAYAQYGTAVGIYVLSCRTQKGYDQVLGLFRDMVAGSYPVKIQFKD